MGYLLIDNRAGGGTKEEYDTDWCRHCQAVLRRPRGRQRSGAFCTRCHGPVCERTPCAVECAPFKRLIEEQLRRDALARAIGVVER